MATRFNFTGTVMFPKKDAKRPFVKEMEKNDKGPGLLAKIWRKVWKA